jgi:hypothetical protein
MSPQGSVPRLQVMKATLRNILENHHSICTIAHCGIAALRHLWEPRMLHLKRRRKKGRMPCTSVGFVAVVSRANGADVLRDLIS